MIDEKPCPRIEITPEEDKIIEQAFEACSKIHNCDECPYLEVCQRLGDKLIGGRFK